MILRRFMKHVSDQNWFAVGLDVLVVITGIFLGMQVTEWNEARKERDREEGYLVNLSRDLEISTGMLREQMETDHGVRATQQDLIELLVAENPEFEPNTFNKLIHAAIFQFADLDIQMTTRDEMVRNGTIDLIGDQQVRDSLLELDKKLAKVKFRYQDITALVLDKIDPFLIQNFQVTKLVLYEMDQNAADADGKNPFASVPLEDQRELLRDREFRNLVAYRYMFQTTQMQAYQDLEKHYIHMQELISKRLKTIRGENQ